MTAEALMRRFSMAAHVENGSFVECHYENRAPGRAASGSIYYYVGPDETTEFHEIDCDEYWSYVKGSNLEIWQVEENGALKRHQLGVEGEAVPLVYLRKGTLFAARHRPGETEGTFLVCITVPRFSYEGFRLCPREEMERRFPATAAFYGREEEGRTEGETTPGRLYENYGRRHYCRITFPDLDWSWCYSAEALQQELTAVLPGQRLRGIYVGLHEYLASHYSKPDVIDLSQMGGISLLVFETSVLALRFRAEGMAEYRLFSAGDLTVQEVLDYIPDDLVGNRAYFFDLSRHDHTCVYGGKPVERVRVPRTTVWGFSAPGFDEEQADRAAAAFDLPGEVYFTLADGTNVRFVGDEYEYYCILLEQGT